MVLEGGSLGDLLQITAALIVLGGTTGAVLVSSPPVVFRRAIRSLPLLFRQQPVAAGDLIQQLIGFSAKARRQGIASLEAEAAALPDPFFRKAMTLAVDGVDTAVIRETLELEIAAEDNRLDDEARVLEAAGGFAPTVGIIGAVLGLIQVMKHLDNISQVGHGIAVAFVSTVYGVGLANLLLLPAAGKLRALADHRIRMRELVLEGVVAMAEGRNTRLIRGKLEAWLAGAPPEGENEPALRAHIVRKAAS